MVAQTNRLRHLEAEEFCECWKEATVNVKPVYDPCPYAPWYVVAWRMVWIIPLKIAREAFLLFAMMGWGREIAKKMRRITR